MSTSTSLIGTRVPTLSPDSIIRAGIPLPGDFYATDVAVSLGSLLSSGVYEPIISGNTNDIAANVNYATYIRVGGIATVSIQLEIIMNDLQNDGSFEISLPVASNFTSVKQCFGLLQWSYGGDLTEIVGLSIGAEITNGTCLVDISTNEKGISLQYCTIQFQYEIV
jgi:hypothetical protein